MMRILKHAVSFGGDSAVGWLPPGAAPPLPAPVRVVFLDIQVRRESGGFLLEWAPSDGQGVPLEAPYVGDLWYERLEDAVSAAVSEFGIDWPEDPNRAT